MIAVALTVVAVGLVIQMLGNQRVAASIWQTDYGDGQAGLVGPAYPGFDSGHILAGFALSLLPPWALPGVGVLFVLAYLLARGSPPPAPRASRSA